MNKADETVIALQDEIDELRARLEVLELLVAKIAERIEQSESAPTMT